MAKDGGTDEGTVFAIGVILIVLCFGGGQATGASPLQFFFVGTFLLVFGAIILGLVIGLGVSIVRICVEAHKQDGRTLWQITKEEYNGKKVVKYYRTISSHVKSDSREYWESDAAAGPREFTEKVRGRVKFVTGRVKSVIAQAKEMWQLYKNAGKGDL